MRGLLAGVQSQYSCVPDIGEVTLLGTQSHTGIQLAKGTKNISSYLEQVKTKAR